MVFLLYFLGGILFIIFFQPIIEKISYFISTYFEYLSYIIARKVYYIQKEIEQTDDDTSSETKNPMGFQVNYAEPQEQQQEDDEDDYE